MKFHIVRASETTLPARTRGEAPPRPHVEIGPVVLEQAYALLIPSAGPWWVWTADLTAEQIVEIGRLEKKPLIVYNADYFDFVNNMPLPKLLIKDQGYIE